MGFYAYKMTRDYGFAPNPFGGVCTLATCKPDIRKNAVVGDWIIGTGSKAINLPNRLIYLMRVTEKLRLEDYWNDSRFQFKKPVLNSSLVKIHGDNVYSKSNEGMWQQAPCQHSHPDWSVNSKHVATDTRGEFVLLSDAFYYFGDKNFRVPPQYRTACSKNRNLTPPHKADIVACEGLVEWVSVRYKMGVHGDPIGWKEYLQSKLNFG